MSLKVLRHRMVCLVIVVFIGLVSSGCAPGDVVENAAAVGCDPNASEAEITQCVMEAVNPAR